MIFRTKESLQFPQNNENCFMNGPALYGPMGKTL